MACIQREGSKWSRAILLLEQAVEAFRKVYGKSSSITVSWTLMLASWHTACGRKKGRSKARRLLERCLQDLRVDAGDDELIHVKVVQAIVGIRRSAIYQRRMLPFILEAIDKLKRTLVENHPITIGMMITLVDALWNTGRVNAALPIAETVAREMRRTCGETDDLSVRCQATLARVR